MFTIKKESLIDWQVKEDGKKYAWITKDKGIYKVSVNAGNGMKSECAFVSFKEAKAFAMK